MSITSKYLEAAIIDQVAAGAFPGKAYAFTAVHENGWKLGVAVANEQGYHPFKHPFKSQEEAQEWAKGLNEHIGLDERRATRIVCSTMFGGSKYDA